MYANYRLIVALFVPLYAESFSSCRAVTSHVNLNLLCENTRSPNELQFFLAKLLSFRALAARANILLARSNEDRLIALVLLDSFQRLYDMFSL